MHGSLMEYPHVRGMDSFAVMEKKSDSTIEVLDLESAVDRSTLNLHGDAGSESGVLALHVRFSLCYYLRLLE